MAGMTFPGMTPLTYAPAPDFNAQLATLGKTLQGAKPGIAKLGGALTPPASPTMPPGTPGAPMNIALGANQPGLMDALKGMSPQQILAALQGTSQAPTPPPAGLPGSAALDSAGMLSQPNPTVTGLY